MELTSLGFDAWFEERAALFRQAGRGIARVTAVDRDAFLIRDHEAEIYAELSGKLRFTTHSASDLPGVGDWVAVQCPAAAGPAIIHDVLPRRTVLRRRSPGRSADFQMIAANLDVAYIVQGCQYDFSLPRLARYLVMAHDGHIEPQIILSKTDLIPQEELERRLARIRDAGISAPVLPLSNATGSGLAEFRERLAPGKTYCLIGSSGVGKTTLINRLLGSEALETTAVSATGEGVHTTARRQLLALDGGALLIDTPGMRELGLLGAGEGIDATFMDMGEYSTRCRFPDCTHTREPGCAVLAALKNGELTDERYQSYLKLRKEAEFHDLSYLEKRQKDRAFGRFIKSAKKEMS
jgi:ribosome biogenesis GTPase / thiamine phosphate phosphatase